MTRLQAWFGLTAPLAIRRWSLFRTVSVVPDGSGSEIGLVLHSSRPWVPSSAKKNRVPPTSASLETPKPSRLMSLTIIVPASVPSLFHSSRPWVPSSAAKKAVPPRSVRDPPTKALAETGLMSFTITVPASVPSLFHSSVSSTIKKSVPPTSASHPSSEEPFGLTSLTITVPASVPSLFHSSLPSTTKKSVPPTSVSRYAPMSLTITVPASVPSLFHSSRPWVPSSPEKNRVPPTFVSQSGAKSPS